MILMQHDIGVQWFNGQKEHRGVSLVMYGDSDPKGYSAMAKTVGLPTGIATRMVLDGMLVCGFQLTCKYVINGVG